MVEDIKLDRFPKSSGAYLFKTNDEVIYVGSSKNLYKRVAKHKAAIRKGSEHGYKQDFYQFLQSNEFTVEFQLTEDYLEEEQKLIEKYNPKYNSHRAYTGLGARKGREAEYMKEYNEKYKEEIKQYYESNKEEIKQYQNQYNNQLCYYNGQTITLTTLSKRLMRAGIDHPTLEAKRYLIGDSDD